MITPAPGLIGTKSSGLIRKDHVGTMDEPFWLDQMGDLTWTNIVSIM